jgi:hypothetical protein
MDKQEAIELLNEKNNLNWNPDVIQDINDRWYQVVKDLHKQFIGRKQGDFNEAYAKLIKNGNEAELKDAIKPFQDEVSARYESMKNRKDKIDSILKEFAKTYTPEKQGEKYCLKTSESWAYSWQPSHNKYAREKLNEDILLLEILGFETEVVAVNGHTSDGVYPSYWEDYQLWANITHFDYTMLSLSGEFISVLNWAVLCWEKGTNPKVYFQFLSDDDYEKSQVLAYHCNYEITRDNMKLELSWDEINKIRRV